MDADTTREPCEQCKSFITKWGIVPICGEIGDRMLKSGLWREYNLAFLRGDLEKWSPFWCPKKIAASAARMAA